MYTFEGRGCSPGHWQLGRGREKSLKDTQSRINVSAMHVINFDFVITF